MKRPKAVFYAASAVALILILVLAAPDAALSWQDQKGVTPTPTPAKGALPTATAQTPALQSSDIEVTSTLEMDLLAGPGRTSAFLSPDGERFAHFAQGICFYLVDGSEEACYSFPEDVQPNLEAVRWSPDSTRLVFMDSDLFRYFNDTDIWTLDVASGQFTNLTDDGVTGGVILKPVDANLDYGPIWSPDGMEIAFLRIIQTQGETGPVTMYSVPADGGDVVARQVLAENGRFRIMGIAWSPDGDTIAYFHDWREAEDAMWSGIWLFKLSDPNPQRILAIDFGSMPNEMTFSPDGANLLVTLRTASAGSFANNPSPEDYPAWVMPVNGAAPLTIDAAHIVRAAAWRAGSSALVYIVFDQLNSDGNGLYFAGGPGQVGQLTLPGEFIGPTTYGERLAWGENGVTLVAGRGGSPVTVVSTSAE